MLSHRDCTIALLAMLSLAGSAMADDPGATAPAPQNPHNDTFMAGDRIATAGDVGGASVLAGGRIDAAARVNGDAVMLGGQISVSGDTRDDLYAVGGDVVVSGSVGHNARLAGGQLTIGRTAVIAGDLSLAGGQVDITGKVDGDVNVAGGRVNLNGPISGDATVRAGELIVGPDARIAGRLRYQAKEGATIDPAARIGGPVEVLSENWSHGWMGYRVGSPGTGWLGVLIVGIILILAWPKLGGQVLAQWRERTGAALGWGALGLFATPVVMVLCAITIIGLPLAVVLLLAYLLALLVGYVSGLVALGQWALARFAPTHAAAVAWQILALALAVVVIGILRRIPGVGVLVWPIVVMIGLGALFLEIKRRTPATNMGAKTA